MSGPTREQVAQWVLAGAGVHLFGWSLILAPQDLDNIAALAYAAGQASEREACANVCDDRDMRDNSDESLEALRCAAAIRARGQK